MTAASRLVGTAAYEPSLTVSGWKIPGTNLVATDNCFAGEVHQGAGGLADVAFAANLEATITNYYPRPQLLIPSVIQEGAGTLNGQGSITLLEPLATDLFLQLSSSRPAEVGVPGEVVISAGATNVTFNLVIGDDALFTGPRAVTVRVVGTNVVPASVSAQILDNETNIISFVILPVTTETNGILAGEVRFQNTADAAISVSLASSDTTALIVPSSVIMPAGATSVVFQASVVDDNLLDGSQMVTLTGSVTGWPTGSTNVVVNDNESGALILQLPVAVTEGLGTLTNAGSILLGGIAVSNINITLQSSDSNSLATPTNLTILAGQSNAFFNVIVEII